MRVVKWFAFQSGNGSGTVFSVLLVTGLRLVGRPREFSATMISRFMNWGAMKLTSALRGPCASVPRIESSKSAPHSSDLLLIQRRCWLGEPLGAVSIRCQWALLVSSTATSHLSVQSQVVARCYQVDIYERGMHFWLINVRTFVLRSNLSA